MASSRITEPHERASRRVIDDKVHGHAGHRVARRRTTTGSAARWREAASRIV
jgi:hypothetical protein